MAENEYSRHVIFGNLQGSSLTRCTQAFQDFTEFWERKGRVEEYLKAIGEEGSMKSLIFYYTSHISIKYNT